MIGYWSTSESLMIILLPIIIITLILILIIIIITLMEASLFNQYHITLVHIVGIKIIKN